MSCKFFHRSSSAPRFLPKVTRPFSLAEGGGLGDKTTGYGTKLISEQNLLKGVAPSCSIVVQNKRKVNTATKIFDYYPLPLPKPPDMLQNSASVESFEHF